MSEVEAVSGTGVVAVLAFLMFLVGVELVGPNLISKDLDWEREGWKECPTVGGAIELERLEGQPEYFIEIDENDLLKLGALKAALELAAETADEWTSYETTDYHVEKTMGYLETKFVEKYGVESWQLNSHIYVDHDANFYLIVFSIE